MGHVTPRIQVLNDAQIHYIHERSLEILKTVGIVVDCPDARARFARHSCRIADDNRVFIGADLVQWALEAAPAAVDIFNRRRQPAFSLGTGDQNQTRFGVGVTNLWYQDPQTDVTEPFSIDHMALAARLAEGLDSFDVLSTPGIARELPPQTADLFATLHLTANTLKPLVLLISEHGLFPRVLDLLEHLHGDLAPRPFILPYFNPITPLVLNSETARNMRIAIERGLPVIYNNYGMSGATAPITPAATLALLNAELLAGLVFSQLVCEGAPIILGSLPAGFDMKRMHSVYTPHTMLLNLACAEMMGHYGLPHSGTSGSGPGWGADLLAGNAYWLNHLTACMGKVGLAPFVGGMHDSLAFCPNAVVYGDDVIRQARHFAQGFVLDDETIGLDEIEAIGPRGNYLSADRTFELFKTITPENPVWPALTLEEWQAQNYPKADTLLREHTVKLLETLKAPDHHDLLMDRGNDFIQRVTKD